MRFSNIMYGSGIALLLLASCGTKNKTMRDVKAQPPVAKKVKKELTIHGDTRIDNYYWLNERENPEVIEHLKAENAYTDTMMKHTEEFQQNLYDEMVARIKKTDESVPYKKNGYYYYSRTEGDAEYPLICRKKGSLDAEEEIILDMPKMAEGEAFFSVGDYEISTNNELIAYTVDNVSRRKYTIYVKNLKTGEVYPDKIENTSGSITWANDNQTLFYTKKDEQTLLPYQVYTHKLGTPASEDKLIYEEKDNTFYTACYKTKSEKYIMIANSSTLTSEVRFIDADKPNSEFKVIAPRERGIEYSVSHYGDNFYIYTNWNAQNFCLMKTAVDKTDKKYWEMVIAPRKDVMLNGLEIFNKYLVTTERENGLNKIHIQSWDKKLDYYLNFDEEVYDVGLSTNVDFDAEQLRYGYTSLTTPSSVFEMNMETQKKTLLK
ncbi:MAG: S9 family peptidase, partial [Flavobacteriaceae bacterium]|nr:S9 family peptidase [Flavobacteriaceae bacterium]